MKIIETITANTVTRISEMEVISWNVVEKDYYLNLLLEGISASKLKNNLVFKGGTALRKIYFQDYRYSEDLDFTLKKSLTETQLRQDITEIFDYIKHEHNQVFNIKTAYVRKHFTDLKVQFVGLRGQKNTIALDFMADEIISDEVLEKPVINNYYKKTFKIPVYSLEEMLAEKLRSLLQRTRVRDYYDVWYLLTKTKVDKIKFKKIFMEKVKY